MQLSVSSFLAGLVFGAFGVYFVKRGKSQSNILHLLIGVTLIAFPYFIESELLTWVIGAALMWAGFKS